MFENSIAFPFLYIIISIWFGLFFVISKLVEIPVMLPSLIIRYPLSPLTPVAVFRNPDSCSSPAWPKFRNCLLLCAMIRSPWLLSCSTEYVITKTCLSSCPSSYPILYIAKFVSSMFSIETSFGRLLRLISDMFSTFVLSIPFFSMKSFR